MPVRRLHPCRPQPGDVDRMTGVGRSDRATDQKIASNPARSIAWIRSVLRRIGLRSNPARRNDLPIHPARGPQRLISAPCALPGRAWVSSWRAQAAGACDRLCRLAGRRSSPAAAPAARCQQRPVSGSLSAQVRPVARYLTSWPAATRSMWLRSRPAPRLVPDSCGPAPTRLPGTPETRLIRRNATAKAVDHCGPPGMGQTYQTGQHYPGSASRESCKRQVSARIPAPSHPAGWSARAPGGLAAAHCPPGLICQPDRNQTRRQGRLCGGLPTTEKNTFRS
jgi:hypothetical protein